MVTAIHQSVYLVVNLIKHIVIVKPMHEDGIEKR